METCLGGHVLRRIEFGLAIFVEGHPVTTL